MPEAIDTITVDGATYHRAGSGWRLRGARDVAVGPRFCALLDEIAALRAALDAARKDAAVIRDMTATALREMPALADGGGYFYPMHDGEGEYIGEQHISEDAVIQALHQTVTEVNAIAARAAEGGTTP